MNYLAKYAPTHEQHHIYCDPNAEDPLDPVGIYWAGENQCPLLVGCAGSGKSLILLNMARQMMQRLGEHLYSVECRELDVAKLEQEVLKVGAANNLAWGKAFIAVENVDKLSSAGQSELERMLLRYEHERHQHERTWIWALTAISLERVDPGLLNRMDAFNVTPADQELIEYVRYVCEGEEVPVPRNKDAFVVAAHGSYRELNRLLFEHIEKFRARLIAA